MLSGVEFFKQKLSELTSILEITPKLKKNQLKIQEVQSVSAKEFAEYEDVSQCCKALDGALKSFGFLLEELDTSPMQNLHDELVKQVTSMWEAEARPLLAAKGRVSAPAAALQSLCVEATIACPQNEVFVQMQLELAEHMRDELNANKVGELMQGFQKMQEAGFEPEQAEVMQSLPKGMVSVDKCKSLTLDPQQQKVVCEAVAALVRLKAWSAKTTKTHGLSR